MCVWLHTAHPLERDRERDKGCARRTAEDVLEQHAAGDVASHLRRRAFDPVRVVEGVVTQLSLRERSREREGRSKAGEGDRRRSKAVEGDRRPEKERNVAAPLTLAHGALVTFSNRQMSKALANK